MKSKCVRLMMASIALFVLAAACAQPAAAPTPTRAPAPSKVVASMETSAPTKEAASLTAPAPTKTPSAGASGPEPAKERYPNAPVTLTIGFAAGGAAEVGARMLFAMVEKDLGQPINIAARPGATSQVALTELVSAKPDGYLMTYVALPTVMVIYLDPGRKAIFTRKDFRPIARHASDPVSIGVLVESKYKSIKDLVDDGKANPEKVKVSIGGIMDDGHLALLMFQKATGAQFAIPSFDGGPPQLNALLGGHIDAVCDNAGIISPHIRGGRVRLLGIASKERSEIFPEVPTFREQGVDLVFGVDRTYAFPAGVPESVLEVMEKAIGKAVHDPEHVKRMAEAGVGVSYLNSAQLSEYWKETEERTRKVMEMIR